MSIATLSNSLTEAAEFFELAEFRDGAVLPSATVAELARMLRDMAAAAVMLELAVKARASGPRDEVWHAVAQALDAPESNVRLFPVVARALPRDPQPAA